MKTRAFETCGVRPFGASARCAAIGLRVALTALVVAGCAYQAHAQEAIYIVRHAERASDEPLSPLSAEGHARAARLADILRDAGITAVFVTEYERTAQTAQPTAARLGLTPAVNKADDTPGLVAKVRALGPVGPRAHRRAQRHGARRSSPRWAMRRPSPSRKANSTTCSS